MQQGFNQWPVLHSLVTFGRQCFPHTSQHALRNAYQSSIMPPAVQLCQCYDAAEAARNIHEDPAWRQAATKVCVELGGGRLQWLHTR
jgi:hypothetical protein